MSQEVKTIFLDQAANEIQQACDGLSVSQLPYFFLVGAGISKPPVKLATEIVDDCREVAKKYRREIEPADKSAVNAYSHWFRQAYPGLIQRQRYLKALIKDKNISQANFRLAHLVLEQKITNLVVTTNFDDFLLRALTLFGKQPIVCDHPRTVERIDPGETEDIQIVHVHGTYWFYDCVNLKDEIVTRAMPSAQTTSTMAALLDNILSRRVPLVVGYSGWEGDVVMSAVFRRLNDRRLPNPLYWFCYRREEVDGVPDWLRKHEDVYFVVPQPPRDAAVPPAEASKGDGKRAQESLPASVAMKGTSSASGKEPTLEAKRVFDKLIEVFELKSPVLTSDPLQFFADHLLRSLPTEDESGEAQGDIYFIKSVIERIERAREREKKELMQRQKKEAVEIQLEKVRDALRRSQYREAITVGSKIKLGDMSRPQLQSLMNVVNSAAIAFGPEAEDKIRCYDFVLEIGKELTERGGKIPALPGRIAEALFDKGLTLGEMNRDEEALAAYEELLGRFGDSAEPGLREQVARSLVNRGVSLSKLQRSEEARAAFDEVVKRFGDSAEPGLREQVAAALYNKGVVVGSFDNREEEVKVYQELMKRFGDSAEPGLDLWVGMALVNMGYALGKVNRAEDGMFAYEEVLKRFGDSAWPALREQVGKALVSKGIRLSMLQRSEEARAVFDEVVKRFGDSAEPGLREQVAAALNGTGFDLLCKAKELWKGGNEQAAKAMLAEANEKIRSALGYSPQDAVTLGNAGYVAFLLGDKERARALLTEAISIGGESVREGELSDAEINTLPQDEEFRELVRSIPAPAG